MKTRAKILGRTVLVVGLLATVALVATAVLGYRFGGEEGVLRLHVLVGMVAVLLLTLSHGWVTLFLLTSAWAVRRTVAERNLEPGIVPAGRGLRRRVVPWSVLAVLLAAANFLLGARVYSNTASGRLHVVLFFATLVVQAIAMLIENWGLSRYDEVLAGLERRLDNEAEPGGEALADRNDEYHFVR